MKMDLIHPCSQCPFRRDISSYLTQDRAADIVDSITTRQGTFSCHKTNEFDYDDEGNSIVIETEDTQHCAGAMILLEKLNQPNQWMRWMERLGMYDRGKLDMNAPVFDSLEDFIEAQKK